MSSKNNRLNKPLHPREPDQPHIVTTNHGPEIIGSTYWGSAADRAGKLWVSVNAGAVRILLPQGEESQRTLIDMRAAHTVILTRGYWTEVRQDGVEFLFDDGTDNPYALHLTVKSFDVLPGEPRPDKPWTLSVWVRLNDRVLREIAAPLHWRRAASIPHMQPLH